MLPDVIGAWKNDGNRGDPGGAGRNGVELDMTSLHDVQPTSPTDTAYQEPQVVDVETFFAFVILATFSHL